MTLLLPTLLEEFHRLLLPMTRVLVMLTVAPVFGTRIVSMRIRMGLALAVSILISPVVASHASLPHGAELTVSMVMVEVLAGVLMGTLLRIVFAIFEMSSQIIALQVGLGFGELIDPQNSLQGPTLSQLYIIVGTLVFLALDGHLMLVATVAESFRLLPVGQPIDLIRLEAAARFGSAMFTGAALVAIPATAALLTVNITVGVLTRAVPQFNMFVAFPGILLLGLVGISLTIPGAVPQLEHLLEEATALGLRVLAVQ